MSSWYDKNSTTPMANEGNVDANVDTSIDFRQGQLSLEHVASIPSTSL